MRRIIRRSSRVPQSVEEPAPEPKVSADDRAGGAAVEALKASRLDFLFRSKPARPRRSRSPSRRISIRSGPPMLAREGTQPPKPQPRFDQVERQTEHAAPVQERRAEPAPADEPHTAAILKSGVVDGMAYTLYADGSIEAKLPHGTVRFGSIAELRAHIESNSDQMTDDSGRCSSVICRRFRGPGANRNATPFMQ